MKRALSLLVITDMARSREFYEQLLDQKVIRDYGANIEFESGFSLQTLETWEDFTGRADITFGAHCSELYLETEDFDGFLDKLSKFKSVELIHEVREYTWGQRVIRFFDPDRHIIEVGQSMRSVVTRFLKQGMSAEQVAQKTQQPIDYVMECMALK